MNDDVEIEKLGLKDLKFIEDQLESIIHQMDELVSQGLYKKTIRNLGAMTDPKKFREHGDLIKLRIRYERRRNEITGEEFEPDPRDGLTAGEAYAFDKGVHWAQKNAKSSQGKSTHQKWANFKKLLLLVAEERWLKEGDLNPTTRHDLFIEFSLYTRQKWVSLAKRFDLLPLKVPDEWKNHMAINLFKDANKKKIIHVPYKALYPGKKRKN